MSTLIYSAIYQAHTTVRLILFQECCHAAFRPTHMPIKGNNTALPTTCQLVDMASHSQTWLAERNTYQWASLQRGWGTLWSWEGLALPTSFHPLPYHWVPDLCERRERGREWGRKGGRRKEEEGREGGRRPQMISLWKHASVEIITIRVPVSSPRDASMSFKSSWSMKPSLFWSIMLNACVGWNTGDEHPMNHTSH